jgi:arginyl-tRNA synthetase
MNIFNDIKKLIEQSVSQILFEAEFTTDIDLSRLTVEPPRDPSHGDMATNAAMVLAKPLGMKPRDLAEKIAEKLAANKDSVQSVEIAGPGFLNIRLVTTVWYDALRTILEQGLDYGSSDQGQDMAVNVEYVSANPTGPLTIAHARGAILGDCIAQLLEKIGHNVQREYYTNDAGNQVRILGESTYLRYREALGEDIGDIPAGHYPGGYLKDVAQQIVEQEGDKWLNRDDYLGFFKGFAINAMMVEIKKDLNDLGVHQDVFYSEASAVANGSVDQAIDTLEKLGLVYIGVLEPPKGKEPPEDWEAKPQTLFRSTDFGDDVDRPVKKSDGANTYFANDIAHYYDIYKMGYPHLINVVGADHGGYVKRAKAAVDAITEGKGALDMPLCAIVRVLERGELVRMSKRAGNFVTLRDIMDRVGAGVMRFIMLTRKPQETLDFDIARAIEQSKDNPYFYVQYAHARCMSVLRHAVDLYGEDAASASQLKGSDLSHLESEDELALIRLLASWPRMIEQAAFAREPHRIAFFVQEVAAALHSWWNKGRDDATMRFLVEGEDELSKARLALVRSVAIVISSALNVIGVEALDELKSDVEIEAA